MRHTFVYEARMPPEPLAPTACIAQAVDLTAQFWHESQYNNAGVSVDAVKAVGGGACDGKRSQAASTDINDMRVRLVVVI